jgi:hypothetical protein
MDNTTNLLFNDFIKKDYSYKPGYTNSIHKMFKKFKNTLLTENQIKQYIKKIGPLVHRREMILLDYLVDKHDISDDAMDMIINSLGKFHIAITDWNWINVLQKRGCKFKLTDLISLYALGYEPSSPPSIKEDMSPGYSELILLCTGDILDKKKINICCRKYNILPDNNCLKIIIEHCHNHIHFAKRLDILLKNKLILNSESIMLLLVSYHNDIDIYISKLIHHGAIFTTEHLDKIYSDQGNIAWHLLHKLTIIATTQNIVLQEHHLKSIVATNSLVIKPNDINSPSYLVHELFFDIGKIIPTAEFCDYVCEMNDEKLFANLIKRNLFVITNESLQYACKKASLYMIENLVNMKIPADKTCVVNLPWINIILLEEEYQIIDLLIAAGLLINYEIIDILYTKGHCFDLEKYNIKYDATIFFILHKNICIDNLEPISDPMEAWNYDNIFVNKYYKNVINFTEYTLEQFKIHIKDIIPNQFYYDNCVCNKEIRKWLDATYNMKPTYVTLARINSLKTRNEISKEYFSDSDKHHPYVGDNIIYYVDNHLLN